MLASQACLELSVRVYQVDNSSHLESPGLKLLSPRGGGFQVKAVVNPAGQKTMQDCICHRAGFATHGRH